jgi:hypothetical protein
MVVAELFAKLGFEFDENAFQKAENALGGLSKGLALVAAAAAAATATFFHEIGVVADMGFEVERTAQKVGVSTDALQELRHGAHSVGVETATLDIGLRRLSRTVFEAAHGSSEAAFALREAGAGALFANGKLRTADSILESVSDRFAKMGDGIAKTALAQKLFGRGGAELIPFLNKGREGIEKLKEEALKYGVVLDKDLIERSKEYKESTIGLGHALEGLKIAMIGPSVGALKIVKALTEWIVANRKIIASGFQKFLEVVTTGGKFLFGVLTSIYNAFKLIYSAGGIPAVILALGALGFAFGVLSVESVAAALSSAVAWAIALLPILAISAAVAVVILALDDFAGYLEGKDSLIGRILARYTGHWHDMADDVKYTLTNLGSFVLKWIGEVGTKLDESIGKYLPLTYLLAGARVGFGAVSDKLYEAQHTGATLSGGRNYTGRAQANQYSPAGGGGSFDMLNGPASYSSASSVVNAPINLTVNSPTGQPEDIKKVVHEALNECFSSTNAQVSQSPAQ